jgi:hypothetical protein
MIFESMTHVVLTHVDSAVEKLEMSSTATTEEALRSFSTVSLKPLLRFIAAECVASMPPTDSSIVDFVINLLQTNKDRLENEFRVCTNHPPSQLNVPKVAPVVETSAPSLSSVRTPASAATADALCDLARLRVDQGFQRRDYKFLHTVWV